MTSTQPNRFDTAVADYASRLSREALRLVAVVRRGLDADDIAQSVAEQFLVQPEVIMAKYPDPRLYARQRVQHAGISFDRRERAQRGEGVRLRKDADGTMHPYRRAVSGHSSSTEGGDELFSFVADPAAEFEQSVTERVALQRALHVACVGISQRDLYEVWLVDGCGWEVLEVARLCGQARETVSRRLNNTRRRMQQNRAGMLHEQGHTE
jgi:DNA-directed RNA polymerase specialized sigma24 family protein